MYDAIPIGIGNEQLFAAKKIALKEFGTVL